MPAVRANVLLGRLVVACYAVAQRALAHRTTAPGIAAAPMGRPIAESRHRADQRHRANPLLRHRLLALAIAVLAASDMAYRLLLRASVRRSLGMLS